MKTAILLLFGFGVVFNLKSQLPVNQWEMIVVDSTRSLFNEDGHNRSLGLGAEAYDVSRHGRRITVMNRDGYLDIFSGNYYYRNPGGNMTGSWERFEFEPGVYGLLFFKVNDDDIDEILAVSESEIFYYEVFNQYQKMFNVYNIGSLPGGDKPTRYARVADVLKGGKQEVLIMGGKGLYMAEIPEKPDSTLWSFDLIVKTESKAGFDVADMNGNGLLDIIYSRQVTKRNKSYFEVGWLENPAITKNDPTFHVIGRINNKVIEISAVDMNGNQTPEIIVSEAKEGTNEKYNLWLFSSSQKATLKSDWNQKLLGSHYSSGIFDIDDLNRTGHNDIITTDYAEHNQAIYAYLNDGEANFAKTLIYEGDMAFPAIRVIDLDSDGDPDIIGFGADNNQTLAILRNDVKQRDGIGKPYFVVWDDTVTITEESRGFHRFQPSLVAGNDWTSPFDFFNGTMHVRYEVTEYPTDEPFQLQFCIWCDVIDGRFTPGNWKEMCSPHTDVDAIDLATDIAFPAEMWRLNPDEPCDFSRISDFRFIGIVVRCANRMNCTDLVPRARECWEQRHLIYPFKVRFSLVALAEGESFRGWDYYIDVDKFKE